MKTIKLKHLIKNIDAGDYLENFLISAVASMLIIRTFLTLTDYPQIGGGTFHISHILWGGLLMVISIIVLLTFLNRELRGFAAILGGMGFGVFIDELGKFITNDNNYFFQPTIAFIYVIFILVYLLYKFLDKPKQITEKEYAVNALEMIKEAVLHDFDPEEKRKAVEFLEKSDPQDPIIKVLSTTVAQIDALPLKKMGFISKFRNKISHYYIKIIKLRLFSSLIITFFAITSILNIIIVANDITSNQSFAHLGILFSSSISGLFVILGIYFITIRRRLTAYEMFNMAILISIFLTQFFLFFEEKLSAITRFLISIIIWSVLQNLIHQEKLIKNNSETVPGQ